ncbi:hypothetical protein LWI28_023103 [Acer negundo]|uniref:Uncharacterized protein n=1 Tax=Acer negundo TaxID=4023 RepID=A0AAD5J708_ACENE|nr:hypothetical protein LWI28_023103 [Acer negundo]
MGTSLWSLYGLMKPGGFLIMTVNGVGAVLQFTYITLFLIYAPREMKVLSAIGFVLGSSQLILYAIYKNKSKSTKSTDVMEEDYGLAHLVKQSIEMQAYDHDDDFDDDGNKVMNDRILNRGTSLPKSSINRQYSLRKLIRTVSLGPYDVFPNWSNDAISIVKRNIDDDLP